LWIVAYRKSSRLEVRIAKLKGMSIRPSWYFGNIHIVRWKNSRRQSVSRTCRSSMPSWEEGEKGMSGRGIKKSKKLKIQ
jgi:hypothetical protein